VPQVQPIIIQPVMQAIPTMSVPDSPEYVPDSPPYKEANSADMRDMELQKISQEGERKDDEASLIYDFVTNTKNNEEKSILQDIEDNTEQKDDDTARDDGAKKSIKIV